MSVLYLYGFAPADTPLPESGLVGVDDAKVEALPAGPFQAVVGRVSSEHYDAAGLEANCVDVEWMAEQGLRHEQVVSWFVDHSTIVPSRLLTLFAREEALVEAAAADAERIESALRRFAGLREWDLKVSWDRPVLSEHLAEVSEEVAQVDRQLESAPPGRQYLLQKKREDLARRVTRSAAHRLSRELLDRLRELAEDTVILEPPAGADVPATLTAALLVPSAAEADLHDRVREETDRLEPLGLSLELTGPWAPYRFMQSDGE